MRFRGNRMPRYILETNRQIYAATKCGALELSFSFLLPLFNSNSVTLVRERTIPIERPPLVGEVSANYCG
jgi:hypothetical protein